MIRLKGFLIAFVLCFTCVAFPVAAEQEYKEATDATISVATIDTVNINTANAERLAMILNGVGLKRAQAIVEYRESNGPFVDAAQLMEIKGIGETILEKNRDKIIL